MTNYEPTELEEMFRDIEGVPYVSDEQKVKKATDALIRRARAIITYAVGACQLPNIRKMLEPLELFAVRQANEIIQPDVLLTEIAQDEVLDPHVLPHLQSLEEIMHRSRKPNAAVHKKPIAELARDLAQLKNVA